MRCGSPDQNDSVLRSGITIIEVLIVIGIISLLASLLLPAVMRAREEARNNECKNNLRQHGLVMHGTREHFGNDVAANMSLPVFLCPSDGSRFVVDDDGDPLGRSNYAGVTGDGTKPGIFEAKFPRGQMPLNQVTDGLSNTFGMGEQDSDPVDPEGTWYHRAIANCERPINSRDASGLKLTTCFRSHHPGGANFLMLDGAVRFVSETIDLKTYHALATINAGEVVGDY